MVEENCRIIYKEMVGNEGTGKAVKLIFPDGDINLLVNQGKPMNKDLGLVGRNSIEINDMSFGFMNTWVFFFFHCNLTRYFTGLSIRQSSKSLVRIKYIKK